jgi:hypothetical protein
MPDATLASILGLLDRDDESSMTDEDLQILLAKAVRLYSSRASERQLEIFPQASGVTATAVMFAATAMLRAVDVQLFELGTWQTFSALRSN